MKSEVFNEDCMVGMARYPDKYFDLAIVDPEFGIGIANSPRLVLDKGKQGKDWDNKPIGMEYFTELFRVSKNQIIWGGNYYPLPANKHCIVWDKKQPEGMSFGMFDYAWTSFDGANKMFRSSVQDEKDKIHPTQKPIRLYRWLLDRYAYCKTCKNEGSFYEDVAGDGGSKMLIDCENCDVATDGVPKILDTHLGSGSSRIAAYDLGYNFTGFELDKDYFEAAEKRYQNHIKQLNLF